MLGRVDLGFNEAEARTPRMVTFLRAEQAKELALQ